MTCPGVCTTVPVIGVNQASHVCSHQCVMPLQHLSAGIPALLVRLTTKMAYDGNRQMLADSIALLRMLLASQVELVSLHVCHGFVLVFCELASIPTQQI